MSEVVMPRLSDSMEEGTILSWLKQVGDEVAVGDQLVEIETDKANMAYEADEAGVLQEILAQEGETLPIGAPIARIGEESSNGEGPGAEPAGPVAAGDPPPPAEQEGVPPTTPPTGEAEGPDAEGPTPPAKSEDGERVKASPLARRLAKDKGLDIAQLHGSGPGGRIVKSDVEGAEGPAGDAVGGTAPEEALATGRGGGSPAATGPAGPAT
jgi:pyruvate dehydrogenase E2 component (dihydrolipoamide acetyltransferase)